MDDGISIGSNSSSSKMGASSNPNAARLSALQERKKIIEETLAKRNQELKQLCVQEAELTGVLPPEIPLEPGEIPPSFRKRVGTSFQLPQNLLNNVNNEEESIAKLELEMQVQKKLADAAFSLADDRNMSKTVRRKHKAEYEKHKKQYEACQEKLQFLKTTVQATQNSNQQKQKKKPRPVEKDDTVSMHTNLSEPLGKSSLRHSMRSLQHPLLADTSSDHREYAKLRASYSNSNPHCNAISPYVTHNANMFFRLTINDYKNYVERRESNEMPEKIHQQSYLPYTSSYMPQSNTQYNTIHTSSPNHLMQRTSIPNNYSNTSTYHYATLPQQHIQDYNKSKLILSNTTSIQIQRQTSGSSLGNHKNYYSTTPTYRHYDQQYHMLNPHQLQPHQQYEHVMTTGLGGFWKQSDNGEMIWCNSVSNVETAWQGDKVFGSLDRRRNKRTHKTTSSSTETKLDNNQPYNERIRNLPTKSQILRRQEKLVRTQSLGSVGAQTIDSVWPSDDNSSCEIEVHHNDMNSSSRKIKQKEWYETSLDGPATTQTTINLPTILAPEEKYSPTPPPPPSTTSINLINATPQTPKPVLEIPAESNPSPRIQETSIEMFNNNMPKNCTIVHPGQCKPYHEETKAFEMADVYKYSTKFKKNNKLENDSPHTARNWSPNSPKLNFKPTSDYSNAANLQDHVDDDSASVVQKGIYHPLQPMKCQPYSPSNNSHDINNSQMLGSPGSLNTSLDLSHLTPNVAENFSAEMNAWYQNHENQIENNNAPVPGTKIRTTATLV